MLKWWKKQKAVWKLETQSDYDPFYPWTDSERVTPDEADDQELRDAISMFLYDKPERRRLHRKQPKDGGTS